MAEPGQGAVMAVQPLPRLTVHTLAVLAQLRKRRTRGMYGLEVIRATGLKSGCVYPILHRLEARGWVASQWEQLDAQAAGRPPRRLYLLTPEARPLVADALSRPYLQLLGRFPGHGKREPHPGPEGRAAQAS